MVFSGAKTMFHPVENVQYSSNDLIKHLLERPIKVQEFGDRTSIKRKLSLFLKQQQNHILAVEDSISHQINDLQEKQKKAIEAILNKKNSLVYTIGNQVTEKSSLLAKYLTSIKNKFNDIDEKLTQKTLNTASSINGNVKKFTPKMRKIYLTLAKTSIYPNETYKVNPKFSAEDMTKAIDSNLLAQKINTDAILKIIKHPGSEKHILGTAPLEKRNYAKILRNALAPVLLSTAALIPIAHQANTDEIKSTSTPTSSILNVTKFEVSPVPQSKLFNFLNGIKVEETSSSHSNVPFLITEEMNNQEIISKLYSTGHRFEALAMTLEGLETKPYRDGCGLNVGMGYCIDARVREHGIEHVKNDLLTSGISDMNVAILMGNDRNLQNTVTLDRTQAVALLGITKEGYETRARDIVGQKAYDRLDVNQKAVITWLSYNTGDGLNSFNSLKQAIRNSDTLEASKHLTPYFSDGGKMVPNMRAGSWLMASYYSDKAMETAINNPDRLEYNSRQGISPIRIVAPLEARKLAANNTLPDSPYVMHSNSVEPSVTPVKTTPEVQTIMIANNTIDINPQHVEVTTIANTTSLNNDNNEPQTAQVSDEQKNNFMDLMQRRELKNQNSENTPQNRNQPRVNF